ncbi:hypothetical protein SNEBB_010984 [Seison nebaliae]|nr:hypothetical protein SNEBB_010984 [Seison nebaliae]
MDDFKSKYKNSLLACSEEEWSKIIKRYDILPIYLIEFCNQIKCHQENFLKFILSSLLAGSFCIDQLLKELELYFRQSSTNAVLSEEICEKYLKKLPETLTRLTEGRILPIDIQNLMINHYPNLIQIPRQFINKFILRCSQKKLLLKNAIDGYKKWDNECFSETVIFIQNQSLDDFRHSMKYLITSDNNSLSITYLLFYQYNSTYFYKLINLSEKEMRYLIRKDLNRDSFLPDSLVKGIQLLNFQIGKRKNLHLLEMDMNQLDSLSLDVENLTKIIIMLFTEIENVKKWDTNYLIRFLLEPVSSLIPLSLERESELIRVAGLFVGEMLMNHLHANQSEQLKFDLSKENQKYYRTFASLRNHYRENAKISNENDNDVIDSSDDDELNENVKKEDLIEEKEFLNTFYQLADVIHRTSDRNHLQQFALKILERLIFLSNDHHLTQFKQTKSKIIMEIAVIDEKTYVGDKYIIFSLVHQILDYLSVSHTSFRRRRKYDDASFVVDVDEEDLESVKRFLCIESFPETENEKRVDFQLVEVPILHDESVNRKKVIETFASLFFFRTFDTIQRTNLKKFIEIDEHFAIYFLLTMLEVMKNCKKSEDVFNLFSEKMKLVRIETSKVEKFLLHTLLECEKMHCQRGKGILGKFFQTESEGIKYKIER